MLGLDGLWLSWVVQLRRTGVLDSGALPGISVFSIFIR